MRQLAARVVVIVVDWNSGRLLERCLSSLGAQTRTPDRVVVVDNAGEEPSRQHLQWAPPRTEVIRLSSNRGFAAACNLGIARAADCEWVALLNPDAFADPDWLESLLRAAAEKPAHASFASRLLIAEDPGRLDGTGDCYAVSGLAFRRDHGAAAAGHRLEQEDVFGPCGAAALFRRKAVLQVGGFDESFFCYFEDVDLAFRLRLAGHRCLYVPEAVVRHVGSATTVRHSAFSVYHAHRNLVWTFVKNMPGPLLGLYMPHHLLLNLVSIAHFSLRGQAGTILRAKWDALRGLARVWRARRTIQNARTATSGQIWQGMIGGRRALGIGRFQR